MPFYTFECPACKKINDFERKIANRNDPLACECGCYMDRVFTAPNIGGDLPCTGWRRDVVGYDPGLDEVILSESHRKEVMKRKGLREYEPDPEQAKIREEKRYVKKHADGNEAAGEIAKLSKEASGKRRKKNVSKVIKDKLKDL